MKTQTQLNSIFGTAFIALLLLMVSCDAANPSALVGRWILVEESTSNKPELMELLSDGTGIVDEAGMTWKSEKDRFFLTHPLMALSWNYKVSGSTFTLIDDKGIILRYTKCKKDCQESAKEYAKAKAEQATVAIAKAKQGSFTDARDNKTYKTVKLDNQTWMAENLNYNADGSKCYENQESNCQKYGRLYNWETAKSACPKSWHLPSDAEWKELQVLVDLAGSGGKRAGNVLKASSGWNEDGNGVDAAGFSALPGGYYDDNYSSFKNVGSFGGWWTATEDKNDSRAYGRYMSYYDENVAKYYNGYSFYKSGLYSVRCVKD